MKRAGLRLYSIHLPPPYTAPGREPDALREGFNLTAFLLTVVWTLANRLWLRAGVLAAVIAILYCVGVIVGLNWVGFAVVILAIMAWVGMEANDWLRADLVRRGWRAAGVIAAENEDAALRRYGDLASLDPPVSPGLPTGPPNPIDDTAAPRTLEGPASA